MNGGAFFLQMTLNFIGCCTSLGEFLFFIYQFFHKEKLKFIYKEISGRNSFRESLIYYSVYFFIQPLRGNLDSSTVFLFNNVAIVMLSTLLGIALFKEKILRKNWIGIALAVVSIILVALTTQ